MVEEDLIVEVEQGKLLGKSARDFAGNVYRSFQGVPYAKPPLGSLRFKAPQPPEKWLGVRDATKEGDSCYSNHIGYQYRVGSEDCLFLNVYAPQFRAGDPPKPVMVWIHGGGFTSGSGDSDMYGPDYLVARDVIVVTINYRIGVLGFLSFEDPELGVPGNAGMKDQVMALRWVRENIARFGGDPDNVTIFGESAGGASVHYLMLSPMAKGLFHKAICQSGCALNSWACGRRLVRQMAEVLKYEGTSEREILEFLQSVPVDELYEAQLTIKDSFKANTRRPIGPVIERVSPHEPAFLAEDPLDVILRDEYHKVPLIMGYNDREGILHDIIYTEGALITDFEECIPHTWLLPKGSPKSKLIAGRIKEFYYGDEEPTTHNKDNLFKVQTDTLFFREIRRSVMLHAGNSPHPVYLYRFCFDGELNIYKKFANVTHPGACHADELAYMFTVAGLDHVDPDSDEGKVSQALVRLWTNFARHGNPNLPKRADVIETVWRPVSSNGELHFLDVNRALRSGVNPDGESSAFWDEMHSLTRAASKL